MSFMLLLIYILVLVIFYLVVFAVFQIKRYKKLSPQEQVIFLAEAEKVFSAFYKVPNMLWEEEYEKYMEVLNQYQNIRVVRWTSN